MTADRNTRARVTVMTSLVAAFVMAWAVGRYPDSSPAAQGQSNFMGGSPSAVDAKAVRTSRLRFPAGSRSNWHSHSWGQLLMVEEGRGRTQERGGPVREMLPGEPWFTKAGVEHWHGAAPDEDMLQLTISEGTAKWLEPVSDTEYLAGPRR